MILFVLAIIALIGGLVIGFSMDEPFPKVIGAVLAVILLVMSCASFVSTGYTGIVTTFGKVHNETLDAGLHFHAPWDNVVTMDNREQRVPFQLEAFSKDIQQTDVQGSINYNIDKSTAMILYKEVGVNYVDILIKPRIPEVVKVQIAKYTAENLVANRQAASDAILEAMRNERELKDKGINIISFQIENLDFTDAFETAVEAKQVATQKKQQAQTEQEQKTMEETQQAERKRIAAQAEADVRKINADAEAYATQVKAEAEAEANKKLNSSITEQLVKYNQILRWNGQLPTFMGGESTMPILNFGGVE